MRHLIFSLFILLTAISSYAQKEYVSWSFATPDRIYSHPVADSTTIYFGSDNMVFYAVGLENGLKKWSFEAKDPIRSTPAMKGNLIYFSSGNNLYALQKKSGEVKWVFRNKETRGAQKMDEWDYHFGSPVVDDSIVYFGCGEGKLYGFNARNGRKISEYSTVKSSPIRSVPVVFKGVVYFGDAAGKIYAWDAVKKDTLWTYQTYDKQPYPTFGNIITPLVISDPYLIFGSRNPELQVLNVHNSKPEWSYTAEDGGWISGSPLIDGNNLYIGGSDCHKLFAFHVKTGKLLWSYNFPFNNFSSPVIHGNYLIFTTGNAYANEGKNAGYGYVYALNKKDGTIVNYDLLGGNLFSNPVVKEGKIYLASNDGYLYAMDLNSFLNDQVDLMDTGYDALAIKDVSPNPFVESTEITYTVNYPVEMSALIRNKMGDPIKRLMKGSKEAGEFRVTWDGKDDEGNPVPNGFYFVEMRTGKFIVSEMFSRNKK